MCAVLASGTQIQISIGLVTMNGSALSMFLLPMGEGYSRINDDLLYVGMGYGFYLKKINIQLGKQVVIVINTF